MPSPDGKTNKILETHSEASVAGWNKGTALLRIHLQTMRWRLHLHANRTETITHAVAHTHMIDLIHRSVFGALQEHVRVFEV